MRIRRTTFSAVTATAVTAFLLGGLSPATADGSDVPAPTLPSGAPAPTAVTDAPTDSPSTQAAEADDPPVEDAEGLIDLNLQDKTISVPLPLGAVELPLGIAGFDLDGKQKLLVPPFASTTYGGEAVALNVNVNVLGLLSLKSRKLGAVPVGPSNNGGGAFPKKIVSANMPELFFGPPEMGAYGGSSYTQTSPTLYGGFPKAEAGTKIAELVAPLINADGIEATARAEQLENGEWETVTHVRFARLDINGVTWQDKDVEPNRTQNISGLGKVVLNEQKITRLPGDRYAAKVTAIHITLSTAKLGLPVGTDIYIGTAEAIAYE
jgi:hypothetical protein